jgi:hypothetical protein
MNGIDYRNSKKEAFLMVLQEKRPLPFLDVFAWIGKWFDPMRGKPRPSGRGRIGRTP